jgi:hypothetical protein
VHTRPTTPFASGSSPVSPQLIAAIVCDISVSLQAEFPKLFGILFFLKKVLFHSTDYRRAAIKGNLIPGLVRALREYGPRPNTSVESVCTGLETPISCLTSMMWEDPMKECWKPAIDAGLVPLLVDYLALPHAVTVSQLLHLVIRLLVATPQGVDWRWACGLPDALVQLMKAPVLSPAVASQAMSALVHMCQMHRQLLAEYGIIDRVQEIAQSGGESAQFATSFLELMESHTKFLPVSPRPHPRDFHPLSRSPFISPVQSNAVWLCTQSMVGCAGSLC